MPLSNLLYPRSHSHSLEIYFDFLLLIWVVQRGIFEINCRKLQCHNGWHHGVWKSQKTTHTTLRAKRATFTFWVDKSWLKMPKMVHFGKFLKTWSLRSNSVTRQVSFNRTKIGGKCDILSNFQAMLWQQILILLGLTSGPKIAQSVNTLPKYCVSKNIKKGPRCQGWHRWEGSKQLSLIVTILFWRVALDDLESSCYYISCLATDPTDISQPSSASNEGTESGIKSVSMLLLLSAYY